MAKIVGYIAASLDGFIAAENGNLDWLFKYGDADLGEHDYRNFIKSIRTVVMGRATYDFVTTNDIIGGNSGSPVIDRRGRVIGAAFDGNIHSLGGNYGYDGTLNRTVVVSTDAVQEALEKIYPAPNLVAELRGGR